MEKTVNLVKRLPTFKINIPKEVESKIRFLCQRIWDVEWSGILFYTYSGTFEDENLEIICKDIFLMDVGNSTYTEFDMSTDVASYMAENPELLDYQSGLVHSHNSMSAFFSGTDLNTLKDEGFTRNNFVSLIVNNAGQYAAAITRKVAHVKNIKDCYSYGFFGEGNKENCEDYKEEQVEIEYFNLEVNKETIWPFQEMEDRIKNIKENKKPVFTSPLPLYNMNSYNLLRDTPTSQKPLSYYTQEKMKEEKVKEGNLFEDETDFYKSYNPIFSNNQGDADPTIVESLLKQLITGCVVANSTSTNINNWVNKMEEVYSRRFPREEGLNLFRIWADTYCEFLIWYIEDEVLSKSGYTDEQISELYAVELIKELQNLPKNKYIDIYIESLSKYSNYE